MFCSIRGRSKLSYRVVFDSGNSRPTLKPWSMLAPLPLWAAETVLPLAPPQAARPTDSAAAMPVTARPLRIENRIPPSGCSAVGRALPLGHFVALTVFDG